MHTFTNNLMLIFGCMLIISCKTRTATGDPDSIIGTWKLLSATTIEKGDTTIVDYSKNLSFIKIINETHFAFLQHDLNKGKDSTAVYVSGGGKYTLADKVYKEQLEYCSAREWEGHDFTFNISLQNDTLIQKGQEVVESAGVNRINIEKYVRLLQ